MGLDRRGGSPYPSCISLTLVVAPGDSCSFVPYVVWQGMLGDTTATLTVHSDQGTTDIPVSANFQASIADYLPKGYFWFPQVVGPAPKTHTFYIKNDGNIDLNTTSVTLFDGQPLEPSFHIVSDGCSGAPVTPGATCPITVSFDGPSDWKVGTELEVTTDATPGVGTGSGPTLQFDMTGVRIRLAVLSHALSAHRFTPVDASGNTHGVSYTFKTTTPAHDTLQVVNSHGHVVKSWTFRYIKRTGKPKPKRDLARPQQTRDASSNQAPTTSASASASTAPPTTADAPASPWTRPPSSATLRLDEHHGHPARGPSQTPGVRVRSRWGAGDERCSPPRTSSNAGLPLGGDARPAAGSRRRRARSPAHRAPNRRDVHRSRAQRHAAAGRERRLADPAAGRHRARRHPLHAADRRRRAALRPVTRRAPRPRRSARTSRAR